MIIFNVISIGLALMIAGCSSRSSVIPLDMPIESIENAIQDAKDDSIFQIGESIPNEWWLLFNDTQLNGIIQATLTRNPALQSAQMQILAAAYQAASLRAALYPYFSWGADVSRQKLSTTGVIPFASGPAGSDTPTISVPSTPGPSSAIPEYFTLYETEFNLKYEFDFWNKNRNTFRQLLGKFKQTLLKKPLLGCS